MMTVPQSQRTEPDETAHELMEAVADDEGTPISLFDGPLDWPGVVEASFAAEMTICWW